MQDRNYICLKYIGPLFCWNYIWIEFTLSARVSLNVRLNWK